MTVRPFIEQWFPAPIIGAESLRERGASSALPPLNFLHVWWARRPLTASRAAVVGSMLPAWPTDAEAAADEGAATVRRALEAEFPRGEDEYRAWFIETLGILGDPVHGRMRIAAARETGERLEDGGYGYPRAFTSSPEEERMSQVHRLAALRTHVARSSVLDPFAGGGAIPFEAARFGFEAVANELNPVAAAILHGTVALPSQLGVQFGKVIERWGTEWAQRVGERLVAFYPKDRDDASIVAYIWAHTVPCPTTGRPTPLAPNYWLASPASGREIAIRVEAGADGTIEREVLEGEAARAWGARATKKGRAATSLWTGETFSSKYVAEQATNRRVGTMLLAVCRTESGRRGRWFRAPSAQDDAAIAVAEEELRKRLGGWEASGLIPVEDIPPGEKTDEPRRMGLLYWQDLFTSRQMLFLGVAAEELAGVMRSAKDELGESEARALNLYLSFAVSKALNYNSRLSTWHPARVTIANAFDRHDYAFKWSFGEFDGGRALVPWAVDQIVDAYNGIAALACRPATMFSKQFAASVDISLGSATQLHLPPESVDAIITDPPYYNNVMYAECSDFFYVWQKRLLRDDWSELRVQVLTDKEEEAVANPSLFRDVATYSGRGKRPAGAKTADDLADEHYERMLTRCFRESHRVLKPDGVMTVMFTHKRVDAWDTLGQALLESGFSINSSWPVHTESEHSLHQAKKNAASSTIFLTCRKRGDTSPAYWADIRAQVVAAAREAATELAEDGLVGIDLTLATFGPVLSVLSRNWPVYTGELDAQGNPQVLRPDAALDLAREEVARLKKRGLLGGRDVEFDRVTDWYLLAWSDFAAAEFPYDEARKLSIATHLEIDDLTRQYGLVRAASGSVTLLTPAQRRTAKSLDPDAASWATLIDALHALMLTYDEEGLPAARVWLERTGKGEDQRFNDVVAAALHAIPRVKDKGEFARPEARTLEGLRATLFDYIPAPVELDEVGSAQAALFG